MSEDGEAHAWLGPAALLGPASPDLTVVPSSSSSPPLPRNGVRASLTTWQRASLGGAATGPLFMNP